MIFRRDKNVFTSLSRLNFRRDSRHDKNVNHVIVVAVRFIAFQARQLRKITFLSWLKSGATKTYINIYFAVAPETRHGQALPDRGQSSAPLTGAWILTTSD